MNGFLCINKPQGPSSFQIIDQLRRILHIKKAGHAGTLDPHASGLLLVAIGASTRLLQYLPTEPKEYEFGIQFGAQTDTLDAKGEMIHSGGRFPSGDEIRNVLKEFVGCINQAPPAYSAIKINGVRAYKLARKGDEPDMQPRAITIYTLDLLDYHPDNGQADLRVTCSGGTYVRSLARDIADKLGTFGFASYVHRTTIGPFLLERAVDPENLGDAGKYIIGCNEIFKDQSIQISDKQREEVLFGRDLLLDQINTEQDTVYAFSGETIIAVLKRVSSSTFHPVAVLCSEPGSCK